MNKEQLNKLSDESLEDLFKALCNSNNNELDELYEAFDKNANEFYDYLIDEIYKAMHESIDKEQLQKLKYDTIADMWKVIFNLTDNDLNDIFIIDYPDDDIERFKNDLINEIYNVLIDRLKPLPPSLPPTLSMIEAPKIKDDGPINVNDVLLKPLPPKLTPDEALHNLKRYDDKLNYLNKLKKEKSFNTDDKLDKLRSDNRKRKFKRSLKEPIESLESKALFTSLKMNTAAQNIKQELN